MTESLAHPGGRPRAALLASLGAAVALIGGWILAQSLAPDDFNPARESISALAATGMPHRWAMTTSLVLTGVLLAITAWCLTGMRRAGRIALGLAGAATLAVAALPLPARGAGSVLHTVVAGTAFVLLALWPWLGSRTGARGLLRPTIAHWASIVLLCAVASLSVSLALGSSAFGAHERIVAGMLVTWPFLTALVAWIRSGWPIGSPKSKHVLTTITFTALAALGGITATTLAPVTVQTDYYQATVALSPSPHEVSTITVPTIVGDLSMRFQGVAPGIEAVPQIRAEITDALAQPGISASRLQPSSDELTTAVTEVAVQLAIRFLIGAFTTAGLLLVAYILVRHRTPRRWLVVSTVLAAVTASVGTSALIATTYRVDRQPTFATTGVLTAVHANIDILGDVEARSAQVAPYLRNLIVLSGALQEKYSEHAVDERDVALRLLLVSDIHGANYYPLMRSIIEEEQIDAVIDTGDIVNFGSPAEFDASRLRQGIESLGVPYLFVRGNHDARAELDYAVVDAIAAVPGAYVLQPSPDRYIEVELGGVRIAGFNDPRWFGDSGAHSAQLQEPEREQFLSAFDGLPAPDVVVSHEPWAVADLADIGIAVNGHMHSPDLQGNRIQVGTFTGGGPFSHFRETQPGEELAGQPYAFDVLTFGTDCRLSTLMRYQFRNIVSGHPAYDDISLVNGARIDTRPVDQSRECRAPTTVTQRTVTYAPAPE